MIPKEVYVFLRRIFLNLVNEGIINSYCIVVHSYSFSNRVLNVKNIERTFDKIRPNVVFCPLICF